MMEQHDDFLKGVTSKILILITLFLGTIYFVFLFLFKISSLWLFGALVFTQLFQLWLALGFWFTSWDLNYQPKSNPRFAPPVDVLIPVSIEDLGTIEEITKAALAMNYPKFKVYLLNDGFVAGNSKWKDIEKLAKKLGAICITRKTSEGAKAGNINNGLKYAKNDFVALFDSDQIPHKNFLKRMMSFMDDENIAFAQSPQYYKNKNSNIITKGAWEQQKIYYGPICRGKNRMNSAMFCGTNAVIRKKALLEVNGIYEKNIAEDFLTSLFIHKKGWKSVYVPEVLADGLAPNDFLSYYKQQFRWARGSLDVLFRHNPLFMGGLSWKQKLQYLWSASYFASGLIVLLCALFPIVFFFTGLIPLFISTSTLALLFVPYIVLMLTLLSVATNSSYIYRAIIFSMSSFTIHIKALLAALVGFKNEFQVTSKKAQYGNFLFRAKIHILYLVLSCAGIVYAANKYGFTSAVASNVFWAVLYSMIFSSFILAALCNVRERAD